MTNFALNSIRGCIIGENLADLDMMELFTVEPPIRRTSIHEAIVARPCLIAAGGQWAMGT